MPAPTLAELMKSGDVKKGSDPSLIIQRQLFGIPKLDEIIGGGLPKRRNVLIVGNWSSGKTFLSQMAIKAVQKAGGTAALVDAEFSFDIDWWNTSGVDTDALMVSQPEYGEKAADVVVALLQAKIDIVVLDSVAALIPAVEEEESAEKQTMGQHAKLVTKAYKKLTVANKGSVFIGINQLRHGIGPYAGETYPGGEYHKFISHLILKVRREGWIKEKIDGHEKKMGFDMSIEAVKNKVGTPFGECTLPFYFTGEIDELVTNIDLALAKGIITQGGAWYKWGDREKWVGKMNVRIHFQENPNDYADFLKELGE